MSWRYMNLPFKTETQWKRLDLTPSWTLPEPKSQSSPRQQKSPLFLSPCKNTDHPMNLRERWDRENERQRAPEDCCRSVLRTVIWHLPLCSLPFSPHLLGRMLCAWLLLAFIHRAFRLGEIQLISNWGIRVCCQAITSCFRLVKREITVTCQNVSKHFSVHSRGKTKCIRTNKSMSDITSLKCIFLYYTFHKNAMAVNLNSSFHQQGHRRTRVCTFQQNI